MLSFRGAQREAEMPWGLSTQTAWMAGHSSLKLQPQPTAPPAPRLQQDEQLPRRRLSPPVSPPPEDVPDPDAPNKRATPSLKLHIAVRIFSLALQRVNVLTKSPLAINKKPKKQSQN